MRSSKSNDAWGGRYRIVNLIGCGGMGRVFRARLEGTRGFTRTVALKLILPSLSHRREIALLFEREAKNAVLLDHPNIVKVLELGEHNGELFIAMDFIDGFDLAWLIKNRTSARLDAHICAQVVYEIALALRYAHECIVSDRKHFPILHCDISPQNVMIDLHGKVKLLDFGISRRIENLQHDVFRFQEFRIGKRPYMAPEVITKGDYSALSDIYSTGMVLFELLTGGLPLLSPREIVCHENEITSLLRKIAIPDALFDITLRTLAYEPCARYQSASELVKDLELFLRASSFSPGSFRSWVDELLSLRSSVGLEPKADTKSFDGTLRSGIIIESKQFTTASLSQSIGSDCGGIHSSPGDGRWLFPSVNSSVPIGHRMTNTKRLPSSVWDSWFNLLVALMILSFQFSGHWPVVMPKPGPVPSDSSKVESPGSINAGVARNVRELPASPKVRSPGSVNAGAALNVREPPASPKVRSFESVGAGAAFNVRVQPSSQKRETRRHRGIMGIVPVLNQQPTSQDRLEAGGSRVDLPTTPEQPPASGPTVDARILESRPSSAAPDLPPWMLERF